MKRPHTVKVAATVGAVGLAMLTARPVPVMAQDSPAFRIGGWQFQPETLTRGSEFDLTVEIDNAGEEDADEVIVSIGQDNNFVQLSSSKYFDEIEGGDTETVTLRGAVSNTITTGYYSLPIQIEYQVDTGTGAVRQSETLNIGVYIEGIAPSSDTQPEFTIGGWSTQPEQLKRGEEFDLTVTFNNIGAADANDLIVEIGQGTNFVSVTPSQMITQMRPGETQTVTLHGAVSNTITTGHYSIPIQISYYQTETGAGTRLSKDESIGVHVQGIAPSIQDYGRPRLVIEGSELQPSDESGRLDLVLTLRNTGDRWATNVVVNLGESDYFGPAGGSTAIALEGDVDIGETATLTVPLILLQSPGERVTQEFTIEYMSYSGGQYTSTQSVPMVLSEATTGTPRLLVANCTTTPDKITPGATFRLDIQLVNVGGGPALRVFVRLGQDATALDPLAPIGSSNVQYVEKVNGGGSFQLGYDMAVDGSADAGIAPIDVGLEYEDAYGVAHSETETISLQITEAPHLQIGFSEPLPDPIQVGDTFDLPIEVINIGTTEINVSTIEVTSETLRITDGTLYAGPLDGGTSATLVAQAEAVQAGTANIEVRVNYLDSFQQPQVVVETLTATVEAVPLEEFEGGADLTRPREATTAGGGLTFGQRVLRGILGFLGMGTRSAGPGGGGSAPSGTATQGAAE
jgi:hypothetical protein